MNLNIHEFNIFMNNNGYTLIYKANQDTENYSDKSFSNDIPKDYRIRYSLSLTYKIAIMRRIVASIQVRMNSERLPGKI